MLALFKCNTKNTLTSSIDRTPLPFSILSLIFITQDWMSDPFRLYKYTDHIYLKTEKTSFLLFQTPHFV